MLIRKGKSWRHSWLIDHFEANKKGANPLKGSIHIYPGLTLTLGQNIQDASRTARQSLKKAEPFYSRFAT